MKPNNSIRKIIKDMDDDLLTPPQYSESSLDNIEEISKLIIGGKGIRAIQLTRDTTDWGLSASAFFVGSLDSLNKRHLWEETLDYLDLAFNDLKKNLDNENKFKEKLL